MSVKHDPWRQRPRSQDTSTKSPAPPEPPRQDPPVVVQAPAPQHAPPPTDPQRAALRSRLAQLDRDELVQLAGEQGLATHRVRTSTLLDQLSAAGVQPPARTEGS